jgi:hypothetical protein
MGTELKIRFTPGRGALTFHFESISPLADSRCGYGVARFDLRLFCSPSRKASGLSQLKNDQALRFFFSNNERLGALLKDPLNGSAKPSIRSSDMSAQREKTEVH